MNRYGLTVPQLVAIHEARAAGEEWYDLAIRLNIQGLDGEALRKRWRRARENGKVDAALASAVEPASPDADLRDAPEARITGKRAEQLVDRLALWRAAEERFERERQAAHEASVRVQRIRFDEGPVCMVYIGDLHLGASGVDYPLARRHAEIVRDTPGMYLNIMGDMLDNFVLQWCTKIRMHTETTIPQEWDLVRQWLEWTAPKIVTAVSGNHDDWTVSMAGIDYFRDVLAHARPDALYARDDLRYTLDVGGAEWTTAHRHKWRGTSIYSTTHGQERSQKWDQDFRVGVGAHTHTGAYYRTFNAGGVEGLAIQVNTYKVLDQYVRQEGFARSTLNKPVAVIYRDDGQTIGSTSLEAAADMMRLYYRGRRAA